MEVNNNGFDKKSDDSWKATVEREKGSTSNPNPKINPTIIIELLPNGELVMQARAVGHELIAIGMLEKAKDIVKKLKPNPIRN